MSGSAFVRKNEKNERQTLQSPNSAVINTKSANITNRYTVTDKSITVLFASFMLFFKHRMIKKNKRNDS